MAVMKKKGNKGLPPISTASLPDVIFMILFFFMVSTTMREQELLVRYTLPDATEVQKLEKKSLQTDRNTDYQVYIQVQNELTRAFNEVRDEVAMQKFGKKFSELEKADRDVISKAVPMKISEAEPRNIKK